MVTEQIFKGGISDSGILKAFKAVPRHLFVPEDLKASAYADCPLPIGSHQTISQPFMVALMTKVLKLSPGMSVLEIGTGSGYQAAILSSIASQVYTVERIPELAKKAKQILDSLGYQVEMKVADGTLGWPEHAPYDRIIITAAAPEIPPPLIKQLKIGGRLVVPLEGGLNQNLTLIDKTSVDQIKKEIIAGCVFVPLIGKYGYEK